MRINRDAISGWAKRAVAFVGAAAFVLSTTAVAPAGADAYPEGAGQDEVVHEETEPIGFENQVTVASCSDGSEISEQAGLDAADAEAISGMPAEDALEYLDQSPLYSVEVNDDGTATINKPFAAQRLLVLDTDGAAIPDTDGAVSSYDEKTRSTVLDYGTMEQTEEAYGELLDAVGDGRVILDMEAYVDGVPGDYDGWGLSDMNLGAAEEALESADVPQVKVAVIDTGMNRTHEAFENVTVSRASGSFVSATSAKPVSGDYSDKRGHGTHVTGIIASATPDSVSILSLKCFDDDGKCRLADIAFALMYAVDQHADVVNISAGCKHDLDYHFQGNKAAFDYIAKPYTEQGGLVFASAGNEGKDVDSLGILPACCDYVIAVSALDESGKSKADYSNYGQSIDFAAPGSSVNGVGIGSDTAKATLSGTSMASPYLAAFAADLKSMYPGKTAKEIYALMRDMSVDLGIKGADTYYGYGKPVFDTSLLNGFKPKVGFKDVNGSTDHRDDVMWLANAGISKGWTDSSGNKTFRPYDTVARADMAAFVFRLAVKWGMVSENWQPTAEQKKAFSDVTDSGPNKVDHAREIWWMASKGISEGWSAGGGKREFRPLSPVKRQDMAAFLFRFAKQAGRGGATADWKASNSTKGRFNDVSASRSDNHHDEVWWLAEAGVSKGFKNANGTYSFRGEEDIKRCDMATFLHRMNNLEK